MALPQISIIIPLYNEEELFDVLVTRITTIMNSYHVRIQVVLVDDGSTDNTSLKMQSLSGKDKRFRSVLLSRNYGHQIAVSAGMCYAEGTEAAMIMDGDLQDPPELIKEFYCKLQQGFDVVYAIRKKRKEKLVLKLAYWAYYRLQRRVSNFKIPLDSGDFCMISKRVRDIMVAMPEESRYLRGMRSWVGFKQCGYEYNRDRRYNGESKYSLKKLLQLAFNGIFNFSRFPVQFVYRLGIMSIIISVIYIIYLLCLKFGNNDLPEGYVTLIFAISFFSGVQLISLGLIGEYVYRTYNQVRERPLFIVDKVIN